MRSASVGVFEPFARWYMIYLYLARMKFCSTHIACGSFERITSSLRSAPSFPVFVSGPEFFIGEKFFSYDLLFLGIGIVPDFYQAFLGFVLGWHDQLYCLGSEGVILRGTFCITGWYFYLVLSA